MKSAYQKLLEARLRGHANRPMSNAIGVCLIWMNDQWLKYHQPVGDMPFKVFMRKLDDPVFVSRIRHLGPRRVQLLKEYFKIKPRRSTKRSTV